MNSTVSISELRKNVARAVRLVAKKGESLVILQRSKPRAVLADFDYFNALEEAVMDLTDAAEAERAKKEPRILLKDYVKKRWG